MDFNAVQEALRRAVLADETLRSLVRGVYAGYVTDVTKPQFPCITFSFLNVSPTSRITALASGYFRVWVWSTKSYSQCHQILKHLERVWHNKVLSFDNVRLWVVLDRQLDIGIDREAKSYYVVTAWTTRWKEA